MMSRFFNEYLLANYGAAVQLSGVENERALLGVDFFVGWQ